VTSYAFREPVKCTHNSCSGLPSSEWTSDNKPTGPAWRVIETPSTAGLRDDPFWKSTDCYPSTSAACSAALWFGDANTGTYASGSSRVNGSVITPAIQIQSLPRPVLSFWTYYETEDNSTRKDTKTIWVKPNDGPEEFAAAIGGPQQGNHKWWLVHVDLGKWAGREVKIRFAFDSVDGASNQYRGWFLKEFTIGQDYDHDGLPDFEEARAVMNHTWTSPDSGAVASNSILVAHQYGIQSVLASSGFAEIRMTGNPNGLRITINDSTWTATPMDFNGVRTAASLQQNGSSLILRVDLFAAGLNPKQLVEPNNFTITIRTATGFLANVSSISFVLAGKTSAQSGDTDLDGLTDGEELGQLGTLPLTGDVDNDGFSDRMDRRPFTPDDPPTVEIEVGNATWSTGIDVIAKSRWGVKDVQLFFKQQGGTLTKLTNFTKVNATAWRWRFPAGQLPSTVLVRANSSYDASVDATFTYTSGSSPVPSSAKIGAFMWFEGGALAVVAEATIVLATPGVGEGFVIAVASMVVVGLGYWAYEAFKVPGLTPDVGRPARISTAPFRTWNLAPGTLSCNSGSVAKAILEMGYGAGTVARRGASGIVKDYPASLPNGYASTTDVANRIDYAMNHAPVFVRIDTLTAALVFPDEGNHLVDRWTLLVDNDGCSAEIVDNYRMVNQRSNAYWRDFWTQWDRIALPIAATAAAGVIDHYEDEQDNGWKATVNFIDATRLDFAEVESYRADVPDWFWQTIGIKLITDKWDPESVALMVVYLAIDAAHDESSSRNPPGLSPGWYWGTPTNPDSRVAAKSNLLWRDSPSKVMLIGDSPTKTPVTWDDLASVSVPNPFWLFRPDHRLLLDSSETAICSYISTHPGTTHQVYLPSAIETGTPYQLYVELAPQITFFGAGGC